MKDGAVEFRSPFHKERKIIFNSKSIDINTTKKNFVNKFNLELWENAYIYFNDYYSKLLEVSLDEHEIYFVEYKENIFHYYISSITTELTLCNSLKIENVGEKIIDDSETETGMKIFIEYKFHDIMNKFFIFADFLIIATTNDKGSLIESKGSYENIKEFHLNSVTNKKKDHNLFLSSYFEFYLRLKSNPTLKYSHNLALHDAANKYGFYDTGSSEWINNYKSIEKNYENWYRLYKDDHEVLEYVGKYSDDENLLSIEVS